MTLDKALKTYVEVMDIKHIARAFMAMLSPDHFSPLRNRVFSEFKSRLKVIALNDDLVFPAKDIEETFHDSGVAVSKLYGFVECSDRGKSKTSIEFHGTLIDRGYFQASSTQAQSLEALERRHDQSDSQSMASMLRGDPDILNATPVLLGDDRLDRTTVPSMTGFRCFVFIPG